MAEAAAAIPDDGLTLKLGDSSEGEASSSASRGIACSPPKRERKRAQDRTLEEELSRAAAALGCGIPPPSSQPHPRRVDVGNGGDARLDTCGFDGGGGGGISTVQIMAGDGAQMMKTDQPFDGRASSAGSGLFGQPSGSGQSAFSRSGHHGGTCSAFHQRAPSTAAPVATPWKQPANPHSSNGTAWPTSSVLSETLYGPLDQPSNFSSKHKTFGKVPAKSPFLDQNQPMFHPSFHTHTPFNHTAKSHTPMRRRLAPPSKNAPSQFPWRTPSANAHPSATPAPIGQKLHSSFSEYDTGTANAASNQMDETSGGELQSAKSWGSEDTSQSSTPFHFSSFPASLPRVHPRTVQRGEPLFGSPNGGHLLKSRLKYDEADRLDDSSPGRGRRDAAAASSLSNAPMTVMKKRRTPSRNLTAGGAAPSRSVGGGVGVGSEGLSTICGTRGSSPPHRLSPIHQGQEAPLADTSHDYSLSSMSSASPPRTTFRHADPEGGCVGRPPGAGGGGEGPVVHHPAAAPNGGGFDVKTVQVSDADGDVAMAGTGDKVSGTKLNFNSLLSPECMLKEQEELNKTLLQDSRIELKRTFSNDTHAFHQNGNASLSNDAPHAFRKFSNIRHADAWSARKSGPDGLINLNESLDSELTSHERFECELEASQFSPIRHRNDSFASSASPSSTNLDDSQSTTEHSEAPRPQPLFATTLPSVGAPSCNVKGSEEELYSQMNCNNSTFLSSSTGSVSGNKKVRPMPDMDAFDGNCSKNTSSLESNRHDSSSSLTSNLNVICPPTPERTPAWAFNESLSPAHAHLRVDSLTSSKVLAACHLSASDGSLDETRNTSASTASFEPPLHRDKSHVFRPIRSLSMKKIDREQPPFGNQIQNECQVEKGFGGVGSTMSLEADFENLGLLGSGAFADVYKARCRRDNCLYAIKRNRRQFRSKRDRDRALEEVRIMQRLQTCVQQKDEKIDPCPYLLQFVRAWQEDGHFFSQTELCCRDNLRHMMLSLTKEWPSAKKKFPSFLRNLPRCNDSGEDINGRLLPESSVWKICHDVAAGLSHIHSHGIVHHDIKPGNIFFVSHELLGCICKIGDFGIAGDIGSAEDGQEGDTTFMPLELLSSAVKQPSADIFSLGLTLYELASDCQWELPTEGPRWHEIRNGAHPPVLACKRSPELLELVQQMICPKVEARPSADKILSEIGAVRKAGSHRDKFLADYVGDMHEFELARERQIAAAQKAARERRFTPTAAVLANPEAFLASKPLDVRTPTPDSMTFFPGRAIRR